MNISNCIKKLLGDYLDLIFFEILELEEVRAIVIIHD
jgi:hypothetical protein